MEVIAKNCKNHPVCTHGPCLMFERRSTNGSKTGKRFFACSACRDRTDCPFFHWVDDDFSATKKAHWDDVIEKNKNPFTHKAYMKLFRSFKKLSIENRAYCKNCSILVLPGENEHGHQGHEVIFQITDQQLQNPSNLFQTLGNKKAEAQYFFSKKTTQFVVQLLSNLGFTKLLLIGTPKIYECIISQDAFSKFSPLLLDIDYRYMQFLKPQQFCHYNLFNNHFFDGKECKNDVKQFLHCEEGEKIAILLDPPFGGLIDAISYSIQTINKWWQKINLKQETELIPLLWFFPYFFEPRIIKKFPDLKMMDYKVEYLNHEKFGKKVGSKGSPVRIFTNISSKLFTLPESEGYKYCKFCERFVARENLHCSKCKECTTKHGSTYTHCDACNRCVKSSYVHCSLHNKCSPKSTLSNCACSPNPGDGDNFEKCFKCHGYGHRKRDCPANHHRKKKKQRKH